MSLSSEELFKNTPITDSDSFLTYSSHDLDYIPAYLQS